jgi:hypothetical protein
MQKNPGKFMEGRAWLMGRVAALIHDVVPAKAIIDTMVEEASRVLVLGGSMVTSKAKL